MVSERKTGGNCGGMNDEPIFERVCAAFLKRLREDLDAVVVNAEGDIKLSHPGAEMDFRLGVYVYDMEEVRPNGPPRPVQMSEQERRLPDLILALRLMIFANRKVAFNTMEAEDEMRLLEAAMRSIHNVSALDVDGKKVNMSFQWLTRAEKVSLWQSLNCPLQPAVYLNLEPVPIPDVRILRVPPVRERSVSVVPSAREEERL